MDSRNRRAIARRPRATNTLVQREASPVCVPTSRISERYVVDLLPRELNPFRFRRIARDTAGCVQRPYLPVSREIYVLPLGIHAIMYPNCGAGNLLSLLHRSRSLKLRQADRLDRRDIAGSL